MTVIRPWQVWWADLDPTEGREQAGRRPALVVSSAFHLRLTGEALVTVLPVTTRERSGWLHRTPVHPANRPNGFVITEQVRTISRSRLQGQRPAWVLTDDEVTAVKNVLRQMIDV
ncbi:type II toxin-antitoxin system PemK/MazF family toxin [Dactylosporangium sp. NPDC049140]|jgi:mRNA interferase MazF|uniref:type II toxin-antitoxin system PemK/MazF family toxin n=1 Tax=Dactylosporangium sp. NPDC049140 TaxID=3155647 RepID=UPI0033F18ED9